MTSLCSEETTHALRVGGNESLQALTVEKVTNGSLV